jgi:SpoVK/Ycf46/Vps4 family AAA+-type ATPase
LRDGPEGLPDSDDFLAGAREQGTSELGELARRLDPAVGWHQLVVRDGIRGQLLALCDRVARRDEVLDGWGFGSWLGTRRGVTALFSGPSGTGKTMAARLIARELDLDVYRVNLAQIVSKYIGETEKNLERVFAAAEGSNAILLFDEADALFGKRSEVRDARDRYANLEVAYLLQRMEAYDGLAVLSTNLLDNMETSFVRRLDAIVRFPRPTVAERRELWQVVWPPTADVAALDCDALATQYELTGANIGGAALSAAFFAAAEGVDISAEHVERGVLSEFRKLGRGIDPARRAGEVAT